MGRGFAKWDWSWLPRGVWSGTVLFRFCFFFRMGEDIALGIGKCVYIIVYVFVENGSIE